MMKRIALILLLLSPLASGAQNIFNCSGFAGSSSGSLCGVSNSTGATTFGQYGANTGFNGTQANFVPTGSGHNGYGFIYQAPVSDTAFTSTFTFVPNGQNVVFTLNNTNTQPGYDGPAFRSGAGCEGGFYQAYGVAPNNLFALEIDSYSLLNSTDSSFSYSSVQIYQQNQSPCDPNDGAGGYWPTTKFSTSPVALDSPSNSQGTTTGDTYSATVSYNGSVVTFTMYDVTAGGSCPGATCFTKTWSNVAIPSWVNGPTAYVGLVAGIGMTSTHSLYVGSFNYTVDTPSASPSSTPPSAGGTPAANPTFSPAGGSYSGTQSVTLSTTTSGANICYTLAPAGLVITPLPNNTGGCAVGTLYSGPVSVSSSKTLYAIAGTNAVGLPSGIAQAAYTIGTTTASTPTFSPAAGTYTSAQSVTISDATSGATIYYTTNGTTPTTSSTAYTGPITVNTTETLEAIAVATGSTNSAVASATYTISSSSSLPVVSTPTFSPSGGAYTSAQSVSISDATSGATIYYTTNGTAPGTASAEYTGPITVSSTGTLEAIAGAAGYTDSTVASATYTITSSLPVVSTPTFSPAAGTYSASQAVTISDPTSGATIYYTTDGTTPTTSSTKYTGPITVNSTETLEAIAEATGDSAVASAAYTISSQPNFVLGTSTTALSVNSGGHGTVTLTVTPVNGFDSPVVLACSALPTWATCSFDQATVTPSSGAVTTQLTISTSAQSSALHPGSRPFFPLAALAMTVCLFGQRKRRCWQHWLLLAAAYVGVGLLFGCGGTSGGGGTPATPTPKSTTSTVTITAISGTLQGTAAIALTVN
jgi:Chitobiase/beta-hexosaminidase C-terminal domain